MKKLLIPLAAFSLVLIIGCQENSITDPGVIEQFNKEQSGAPEKYLQGTIQLEGTLDDPHLIMNSYYRINGQIKYNFRIYFSDPVPPAPQRFLSVSFETSAHLQYICSVCSPSFEDKLAGFIVEVSEDQIRLSVDHSVQIEKTFSIQGREDGMVLKVNLLVVNDRIKLNAMWLALPNEIITATEINHY